MEKQDMDDLIHTELKPNELIAELTKKNEALQQEVIALNIYNEAKQDQLEFLTYVATVTFSQIKVETIIQSFLLKSCEFLSSNSAYIYCQQQAIIPLIKGANKTLNQDLKNQLQDIDVAQVIRNIQASENETVLLSSEQFFYPNSLIQPKVKYVLILPLFNLLQQYHLLAIFIEDDDNLDSLKLQTLESGRQLVSIAIRRQLTQLKLDKKYNELSKSNETLKSTQKKLTQSEKMASIGQLAAGIAHEINNPVGYVMSNIESLKDYMQQFDNFFSLLIKQNNQQVTANNNELDFLLQDSKEILSTSIDGLTRVKTIVQDLKTFSHSGQEKFSVFNINDAVETVLNLLASEFKYENCHVITTLAPQLPSVLGTKNQLEQVLMNILINAKHAIGEHPGDITIKSYADSEHVCLLISDTGCGMSPQTMQRLFDPFFTTKEVGVGTGLGLSISYKIIEAHQGTVEVESEEGKGSCFKITLPLAP